MEQAKMICETCIFSKSSYEKISCNLHPTPIDVKADHWCGHGVWHVINEETGEMTETYWGDWWEENV